MVPSGGVKHSFPVRATSLRIISYFVVFFKVSGGEMGYIGNGECRSILTPNTL